MVNHKRQKKTSLCESLTSKEVRESNQGEESCPPINVDLDRKGQELDYSKILG